LRSMPFTCIVIDDEPHAILELSELIEENSNLKLQKAFSNVFDAQKYLATEGSVDIVFSDIEMPDLSGLQAAQSLTSYCRFLVFVTAYRNHALQAFAEKCSGYLLKPVGSEEFVDLINRFRQQDQHLL